VHIGEYLTLLFENHLTCTLLIEIDDPAVREVNLKEWWRLPEKMYLLLEDGTRIWATFDERQRGDERVSSVQYMKFNTGGRVPVAARAELPTLKAETN
jgi:uncharacterized protein DUF3501